MSDGTGISWADATWNPVVGCTRVSAGCDNCYAVTMSHRIACMAEADVAAGREPGAKRNYIGLTVLNGRGERHFNGVVRCVEEALPLPMKWRKPRRIFVNSMGDLFHRGVPVEFIDRVFAVMALCPQHTFKVLTKRPERMVEYGITSDRKYAIHRAMETMCSTLDDGTIPAKLDPLNGRKFVVPRHLWGQAPAYPTGLQWPLPNVQLGVSAEDQATWDARVPVLLRCPAAVRIVSCEPLLGPIDMRRELMLDEGTVEPVIRSPEWYASQTRIHQVIVGGESGAKARPFNLQWGIDIIRQCSADGVACWFKQTGAIARVDYYTGDDDLREWALNRRHTIWNSDGLGSVGGVSEWSPRDGQPRLGSVIDVHMGRDSTNPDAWPEDLRVQQEVVA